MDLKKNFQSKSAVNLFLKDFVNYIKAGHCIFLFGDLGVGKTSLLKNYASLDAKSNVLSGAASGHQCLENISLNSPLRDDEADKSDYK